MELMAADLEKQELEVIQELNLIIKWQKFAHGLAGIPVAGMAYAQLLGIYLCQNDTCNAKFLWQRIPSTVKSSCNELANVWKIGQKMWVRDFPGIYAALSADWPPELADLMGQLKVNVRERAAKLVSKAYSSISLQLLADMTGLSKEEAEQEAIAGGWEIDKETSFVYPRKPVSLPVQSVSCEEQLSKLTDFVSFLEN